MKPTTIGKKYNIGKVAPVLCIPNDPLDRLEIRGNCFLLLILREGSAYFRAGEKTFEAVAP